MMGPVLDCAAWLKWLVGVISMLEPQAEDPKVLLEHHRRQAALNFEAGDLKAARWHGVRAQRVIKRIIHEL